MSSILLIDDDEIFCQVLQRAFIKRGLVTEVANNKNDALEKAEQLHPDYAVVDLRMPDVSGLEMIPLLLTRRNDMRIVVLTGYASITTAVEAIKLGATHYLTKPTDADEIMKALEFEEGDSSADVRENPYLWIAWNGSISRRSWPTVMETSPPLHDSLVCTAERCKEN